MHHVKYFLFFIDLISIIFHFLHDYDEISCLNWTGCCYHVQLPTVSAYTSTRLDIRMDMGEKRSYMEYAGRTNHRARRLFKV